MPQSYWIGGNKRVKTNSWEMYTMVVSKQAVGTYQRVGTYTFRCYVDVD